MGDAKNTKLADAIELCSTCGGYSYELIGCCSGHSCGCQGQPVEAKPCGKCNSDGKKEPSLQAQEDWPWFFLTREEWDKYKKKIIKQHSSSPARAVLPASLTKQAE